MSSAEIKIVKDGAWEPVGEDNPIPVNQAGGATAAKQDAITAAITALKGIGNNNLTDIVTTLGLQSTAANQTALAALIGALTDAAVTDPTAAGSEIALLKGIIKQLQGDGTGALPIEVTGSTVALPVDIQYSNTRLPGVGVVTIGTGAAHSAGDVVSTDAGAVIEIDTGLPAGTSGIILSSITKLNQNAVFSGGAGYTLYLFSESPTAQPTNEAFTLTTPGDLEKCIGWITIGTLVDKGASCAVLDIGHNLDFTLATTDTKLYGKLVCNGAETTVTGAVITTILGIAAL